MSISTMRREYIPHYSTNLRMKFISELAIGANKGYIKTELFTPIFQKKLSSQRGQAQWSIKWFFDRLKQINPSVSLISVGTEGKQRRKYGTLLQQYAGNGRSRKKHHFHSGIPGIRGADLRRWQFFSGNAVLSMVRKKTAGIFAGGILQHP